MQYYRKAIIRLEAAWLHRLVWAAAAACRPAVECYRPRQTTMPTDASKQSNTGPLGEPVISNMRPGHWFTLVLCVVTGRIPINPQRFSSQTSKGEPKVHLTAVVAVLASSTSQQYSIIPAWTPSSLHRFHTLQSSSSANWYIPGTNIHFSSHSFHIAAPTVWNSLPCTLHLSQILNTFRKHLKTHLFQSAFNSL